MIEILRKSGDEIVRIGIVLIMMLTTVMPVEKRWMECEVWIFYGILTLLFFGYGMLILKKQRFEYSLTDIAVITWFVYYVGRVWVGNEWPCRMEFLKSVELFLLYLGLRIAFHGTKMSAWVLIGSILALGCYEAYLGYSQMYGDERSRHDLFALTGNFLNPGPYSAYLMIGVVVGLAALRDLPNKAIVTRMPHIRLFDKFKDKVHVKVAEYIKAITWKHLVVTVVVIMAMVLPATWSRAAFLGVAVVLLSVYGDKYWKYRYYVWGSIALAAIAFYFVKQGSADGRLIIWKAALTTWIDTPWLGVGIGGFYHAFAEGMTQLSTTNMDFSSADVPDGSYNILLKVIVEQGVVGGVMAVVFAMITLTKMSRNSSALFWGMVALLVFAMFSYPFDLLPYKVIAVLVVTWSESRVERRKTIDERQKAPMQQVFEIGRIKMFLLAFFFGFGSWQAGEIASDCFKIEKDLSMAYGFSDYYSVEEGYKWMSNEEDNHAFLFGFGKKLREEGRYNESNAVLSQGTRCSADPMFYVLMGNNYKDMKHYDLAEQAYSKAFAVMPNRIYPWYQLMLLYQESGDLWKRNAVAKHVVEMKPKIESRATKDMKKKAMEMLKLK